MKSGSPTSLSDWAKRAATIVAVVVVVVALPGCTDVGGVFSLERLIGPTPSSEDEVVRVVDGDTVVLRETGKSRLIGVDTPEVFGEPECYGAEASAFSKRLLPPGTRVRVGRDVEARDDYGRALVYLRLEDGRMVNGLLVQQGYAVPLTIQPNVRHEGYLRELAQSARNHRFGLWALSTCGGSADRPAAR